MTQHKKEKEKEKLERLDLVELQLGQVQQALQQTPSIAAKSQHSSQQQQVAGIQRLSVVATDSGGLNIPTEHYIKEKFHTVHPIMKMHYKQKKHYQNGTKL